jgi:hypothetical protein
MSCVPPKSTPNAGSSDIPPTVEVSSRGPSSRSAKRKRSLVPRLDDDPTSQDPTTVAEVSDELLREASEPIALRASSVPIRKQNAAAGTPLRAVFLLSHVDDVMSVAEIARTARIPIGDAVESFALLVDRGIIALRGEESAIETKRGRASATPSKRRGF